MNGYAKAIDRGWSDACVVLLERCKIAGRSDVDTYVLMYHLLVADTHDHVLCDKINDLRSH